MGQHKYNPNCKLAKEGKLPPKPQPIGKRQMARIVQQGLREITGIDKLYDAMGITDTPYGG